MEKERELYHECFSPPIYKVRITPSTTYKYSPHRFSIPLKIKGRTEEEEGEIREFYKSIEDLYQEIEQQYNIIQEDLNRREVKLIDREERIIRREDEIIRMAEEILGERELRKSSSKTSTPDKIIIDQLRHQLGDIGYALTGPDSLEVATDEEILELAREEHLI